jgi:hypothetical protein
MVNPEHVDPRNNGTSCWDSLNCDIVEVTEMAVDLTVRPMPESLRKLIKPSSSVQSQDEARRENPS